MPTIPSDFPQRGEIYMVNFNPARGSEQAGVRPAVIVSNDVSNRHSSVVIVAAITSQQVEKRARYPQNVLVKAGDLPKDSIVLAGQLMTITKDRLERRRGNLRTQELSALDDALRVALALGGSSR
jgi:mRNA interferase MazF